MHNGFYLIPLLILFSCNDSLQKDKTILKKNSATPFKVDLHYNPLQKDFSIDTFFRRLHTHNGFNGVVLVAKKGKIVYENCFGFANFLKKDSLKITSRFQLASISKQFTALAILLLRDEGKLKLGQTVTCFFPRFPYPKITIHMLLSHRSGLFKYEYFTEGIWKDKNKGMTNMDLMNLMEEQKPLPFSSPNTHFYYNNINYAILAAIVEKITGISLAQYLKNRVFQPLEMKNTSIYSKAIDTMYPTNLIGYHGSFKRRDPPNWLDGVIGDKGVFSTVEDMFIWDQMLYSNRIINQSSLKEAFTGYSKLDRGHFNYGYGWRLFYCDGPGLDSIHREGQRKIIYHTGWWHGFKNIFIRDVQNHNTIIIFSNIFNSSINNLDPLYRIMKMPSIKHDAY